MKEKSTEFGTKCGPHMNCVAAKAGPGVKFRECAFQVHQKCELHKNSAAAEEVLCGRRYGDEEFRYKLWDPVQKKKVRPTRLPSSGSNLVRFLENPGNEHWEADKWILRYLRGIVGDCLCFGGSDPILKAYTDADMAGDIDNRKFTTGYLFTFSGGAISWQSRLQKYAALSTT
nr:uncharacterized protein LOC117277898 [Nicotiana tomentosiformis]